jgi:hypothetical protein
MGCFFAQPARTRCPNFWSAASACFGSRGIIRQPVRGRFQGSVRFSF